MVGRYQKISSGDESESCPLRARDLPSRPCVKALMDFWKNRRFHGTVTRMCGICGIIGGHNDLANARVRKMLEALVRRGPDDEGVLVTPRAILGMRRLSIIDLEGGRQPAYNEDGTVAVVFNGEIY